ncbi:DUF2087 domain-containing protein [Micromonospora echinofusca]|uniref:DUF2087 domain-containing protein n=2 Tax=Micromonospora echinofusca TaxID=47858 RepID=A0ABS3VJL2_MICEH|nr:DUF2087 domain-containing protein [Micromonospora echinofusca]
MTPEALTPETLVRLLAEPDRMRVLAAIALGAHTPDLVVRASGLSARTAVAALHKLTGQGLVVTDDDGLRVAYGTLRELSRDTAAAPSADPAGEADRELRPFLRDGRLIRFPAQQQRRLAVLRRIAGSSFAPEQRYDEATVDDRLRTWCADGEVDHVTVRRYLVEAGLLCRANGVYWASLASPPQPGPAERYVTAMGLD